MKPKRFTEDQIITILKEHEASMRVQDLVLKHNASGKTIPYEILPRREKDIVETWAELG